jgi:hypothetical protein
MTSRHLPAMAVALIAFALGATQADSIVRRASALQLPLATIRERCAFLAPASRASDAARDCRVSELDTLGSVDGESHYYAVYCIIPDYSTADNGTTCGTDSFNARYHSARGLSVFVRRAGRPDVDVAFERSANPAGSALIYRRPSISRNAAGTMLHLDIAVDGTGNFNSSEYYLRENGTWQRIESEEWLGELRARLPAGLEVWKGVWPNPSTLRAETGLWQRGDGNCCPTGGIARIQLGISNRRFVLQSVEVIPPRDGLAR